MAYSNNVRIEDDLTKKIIDVATKIAYDDGVGEVTVKRILDEMGVTNRVFYNRFSNINEVILIIYNNIVDKIRQCLDTGYSGETDFYEYVINLGVAVLKKTYENKLHFSQYMFEYDSYMSENRRWWMKHIEVLIKYGIEKGYFIPVDAESMSYSVWCFCRGFNADAIGGGLLPDDAEKRFRVGFSSLVRGMKPDKV